MKRAAWEFVHNAIAHPLLALTFNSRAANWLHDVTAERAFGSATSGGGNANQT